MPEPVSMAPTKNYSSSSSAVSDQECFERIEGICGSPEDNRIITRCEIQGDGGASDPMKTIPLLSETSYLIELLLFSKYAPVECLVCLAHPIFFLRHNQRPDRAGPCVANPRHRVGAGMSTDRSTWEEASSNRLGGA